MQALVNVESRDRVTGRWFDLWAGAVAANAMCVGKGLAGVAALPGGLSITLRGLASRLGSNNTSIV